MTAFLTIVLWSSGYSHQRRKRFSLTTTLKQRPYIVSPSVARRRDMMRFAENSRLHRCWSSVASAVLEFARPEDANSSSNKPVDSDVWYASMFLYPNHWQPGHGGALPLPSSPHRSFPTRSFIWGARDYITSAIILLLMYLVIALRFSSATVEESVDSFS
ncbi:hypothetical protein Q4I32_008439 [Leishmania shawi]|uniref:Uncharacterized protein n=1 Tax=Leishmania shawi TaxID=5680 RepID=A0AAW3B7Z7_9TRYP